MRICLIATLKSPLHIAQHLEAGNIASSLDYISGSALRGAWAYVFHQQVNWEAICQNQPFSLSKESLFRHIFLRGDVLFPNLYPSGFPGIQPTTPLPLTARSCKIYSGFLADSELDDPKHGVRDILIPTWVYEARKDDHLLPRICQTCPAPMEPIVGYFGEREGAYHLFRPRRRLLTKTAINNAIGTVATGQLYSLHVLEEQRETSISDYQQQAQFMGVLRVREDREETKALGEFLRRGLSPRSYLSDFLSLRIGADKSRGLGHVELQAETEIDDDYPFPPLLDRLQAFHAAVERQWGQRLQGTIFCVTLLSDTIVRDRFWRYQNRVDEKVLRQAIPGLPPLTLRLSFSEVRRVSGWNVVQRLPKEDALCITKGSVFLYYTPAGWEELAEPLRHLEQRGIGERRTEGFGAVVVSHPFHVKERWE